VSRRHPFYCWQDVVYLGRRCNTAFAHAEPGPLVVGEAYMVARCVFGRDINGERRACVQLAGVASVLLENGRRSRSYAADNFALKPPV
jgi:hypothetical protein